MAYARHRVLDQRSLITGSYFNLYNTPTQQTRSQLQGISRVSDDVVGNRQGVNALILVKNEVKVPTLGGEYKISGTVYRKFDGCPIGYAPNAPGPGSAYPTPSAGELNTMAWNILAATNPSNASVSIPTFVGELKDLPSMVKGWGSNLLTKVAKGHLTWRWAVKPMIRDVRKMLEFTKAVDDRVKVLQHLKDGNTMKRRAALSSGSTQDAPVTKILHSEGCFMQAVCTTYYTSKVWGSTQWKLERGVKLPSSAVSLREFATRLTYGITSYEALLTFWELTPWSWFTDWFMGFGTVLKAQNNTIPCISGGTCVMRTLTAKSTYSGPIPPSDTWPTLGGNHYQESTYKVRHPAATVLPYAWSMPLAEWRCLSILGSLAVLKGSK